VMDLFFFLKKKKKKNGRLRGFCSIFVLTQFFFIKMVMLCVEYGELLNSCVIAFE
jgi:hypothetical protein